MTDESLAGPAIELADVQAAAERIRPHIHRTPLITSTRLDERVSAHVICKAESLQRTGSFKFRGATNAIASLSPEERARGIITYSSGNHGQAISRAASIHGCVATVVMPTDAPLMKRAATEHWGAKVVEYERYTQDRAEVAKELQADTGGVIIPPYDHRQVMAGQGTVALELFDDVPDLDVLVVCLGGGGLLAGCSTVAKAHNPNVIVVGVEPEAGDDHLQSRRAGRRVSLPSVPQTIADGQQTTEPGVLTWSVNNLRVDDFVTVSDAQIIDTMRLLFEQHKLVVEPSGATALAAVLHGGFIEPDMRVGVTISGGNIDLPSFRKMMA